ncbi:XVIPCD domain-containing protein [Stenotrophomonas sp. YAU14D1_LEIMI4_1]|uniref:XVIPCD domain-containing protein n=1 Tax=Stenotrophomonas sp. YAU14D1_LEIMI4_1 TaxID=2072407 RepID=UPI00190017D4|nr:XVIPCD domain-containing protein [Stenotrophomonas sp. YAU14D1_LEIMI4_1]
MDKPRYSVEIVIAAPGTPLVDERGVQKVVNGVPQTSAPGHMFYVLHGPDESKRSFGFAPIEHGSMNGPGAVMTTDAGEYRDPRYSRTLEISEEQYKRLEAFGARPDDFGFDLQYKDVRHNCVDFTWAALNHAGIERKRSLDLNALGGGIGQLLPDARIPLGSTSEGKDGFRPLRNIHGVDSIDPPFPDSELNQKKVNPMPDRRSFQQHILSDAEGMGERGGDHLARRSSDPLLSQISQGVAKLDAERGRAFDTTSENISASLYALAKANGLTHVDHVLLSNRTAQADAAQNIFIVQGEPSDPAHLRASMATAVAAQTPAETSFERAQELSQAAQARSQDDLQQRQVQEQSGPRMV